MQIYDLFLNQENKKNDRRKHSKKTRQTFWSVAFFMQILSTFVKSNYLQYALAMATLRNDSAWAWAHMKRAEGMKLRLQLSSPLS